MWWRLMYILFGWHYMRNRVTNRLVRIKETDQGQKYFTNQCYLMKPMKKYMPLTFKWEDRQTQNLFEDNKYYFIESRNLPKYGGYNGPDQSTGTELPLV